MAVLKFTRFEQKVVVGKGRDFSDQDVMDEFIKKANSYPHAYPMIRKGTKYANAKESKCVIEISIKEGDEIIISATGTQRLEAVRGLAAWMRNTK